MAKFIKSLLVLALASLMIASFASCGNGSSGTGTKDENGILTVVVSASGNDENADGSENKPYATLTAARDAIRALDKTGLTGINVLVKEGQYKATESFKLTAEDSGTPECPITYTGEDGSYFYGGTSFTAADFSPLGDGDAVQYFPEEAREHLVQIDLKNFGFTTDDLQSLTRQGSGGFSPLYCDGHKMSIARFPNAEDGWATVVSGHVESDIEPSEISNSEGIYTTVEFSEDYNERVRSWHDIYSGYVEARLTFLWCVDNSWVVSLDPEEPVMQLQFVGGYEPREGMFFYWYMIPEELDTPGEYYIDENCIMYYYPTENHDSARYTMPLLNEDIIVLEDVKYVTLKNLTIESSRQSGIKGTAGNFMIDSCEVRSIIGTGISVNGSDITIQNNTVSSTGHGGISLTGGSYETLERANNLVYNNYITDWSNIRGVMESAIWVGGCGVTVSHNEACNSVDWGIGFSSAAHVLVEYNHLHDLGRFEGDGGAIHITESFDAVMRYNYIHDIGFDNDKVDFVGVNGFNIDYNLGQVEAYGNVIMSITGNGFLVCGGKNVNIHDNLCISNRRWAVQYTDVYYNGFNIGENDGTRTLPEYMTSDVWLTEFPFLGDLLLSGNEEDFDNPNFWLIPSGSSVKNNFIYFDKANAANPGKGVAKYRCWDICYQMSDIIDPTDDEVISYTSKRGGHPTIEEAITAASGTISLTYEEFLKIGRVEG